MACRVGIVIYCIIQTIAFLFILVGTPIDQFRGQHEDEIGNTPCLTFWGYKEKCYSTDYKNRPSSFFTNCHARKTRFQAAEAFGIISIAIMLLAAIFGFIQLCCCHCLRWLCLVLNIIGIATICICWACMVSEYYTDRTGGDNSAAAALDSRCYRLKDRSKYGAGFALYIVGFGLNIINIIFLMLPC